MSEIYGFMGFLKQAKMSFDSPESLNFQLRMFYCMLNKYLECYLPIFKKKKIIRKFQLYLC